jgi:hypothetical protein
MKFKILRVLLLLSEDMTFFASNNKKKKLLHKIKNCSPRFNRAGP